MKNSFLANLAQNMLSLGVALEDTMVVLPNRRAKRMLLKILAEQVGKPFFAPTIYAIDEFVEMLSPLAKMDKLEQLIQLFGLYKTLSPKPVTDFNEMMAWGPSFLKDVSEIDMQMDDGVNILKTLGSAKTFEIPFGQDEISESQKEKIAFFQLLSNLYVQYRALLLSKQSGYDGLIYRDCAENMEAYVCKLKHKHFVFAGFHVLTPSELAIVKYVKEHFDTYFYFDVDPFYCDFNKDARFSTAHFLSKICERLGLPQEKIQFREPHFSTIPKKIKIVGTAQNMNQIFYAIDCLENIKEQQGNLDDTALVLADESLLLPFLTAYDASEANITMGYPISATPAYALLDSILNAYQTSQRYQMGMHGQFLYHFKDVVSILRNPYVKKYLFENEDEFQSVMNEIEGSQHASLYRFEDFRPDLLPSFSVDSPSVLSDIVRYFQTIINYNLEDRDKAIMDLFLQVLQQTEQVLQPMIAESALSFSLVRFAIHQQVDKLTLPLKGDATRGLQVMGLLETRTLDFKNIIMLSVNEGVLPMGISFNSLIPFDFRFTGETLENYLYKDQVYAYHFFRLLQRAENVVLMYDNDCAGSLVEKSRFITQLEFEISEQQLKNVQLEYPIVSFPFTIPKPESISVKKTPEIISAIHDFEFSASALNVYINCPLAFYLNNLCCIQKPDTFKEKIGSNLIGSIAHVIFENVFNEIKDNASHAQDILEEAIKQVYEKIRALLIDDETFRRNNHLNFREEDLQKGRLYLAVQMVRNDVVNYLKKAKQELSDHSVTILGNELKLKCKLPVGPNNQSVTLKGTIDRLQTEEGHLMVVDYKTGKVDDAKLKVALDDLETVFTDAQHGQFVQLAFYALLCKYAKHSVLDNLDLSESLQCAIISIKEVNQNASYLHKAVIGSTVSKRVLQNVSETFDDETLEALETALKTVLAEIVNPDRDFVQTTDSKHCQYCDFRHICGR